MTNCFRLEFSKIFTYCWHILTRSLSVVPGLSPLMYKLVFDSCSDPDEEFVEDEFVLLLGMLLLRDVDTLPLWLPVWLLELLALDGEVAVGTLWLPYWNNIANNYHLQFYLSIGISCKPIQGYHFWLSASYNSFIIPVRICTKKWVSTYLKKTIIKSWLWHSSQIKHQGLIIWISLVVHATKSEIVYGSINDKISKTDKFIQ